MNGGVFSFFTTMQCLNAWDGSRFRTQHISVLWTHALRAAELGHTFHTSIHNFVLLKTAICQQQERIQSMMQHPHVCTYQIHSCLLGQAGLHLIEIRCRACSGRGHASKDRQQVRSVFWHLLASHVSNIMTSTDLLVRYVEDLFIISNV